MPVARFIQIIVLVILAAGATVVLGQQISQLSVIQKTIMVDGTKVSLALLIIFLCLRMLVLKIRG